MTLSTVENLVCVHNTSSTLLYITPTMSHYVDGFFILHLTSKYAVFSKSKKALLYMASILNVAYSIGSCHVVYEILIFKTSSKYQSFVCPSGHPPFYSCLGQCKASAMRQPHVHLRYEFKTLNSTFSFP